MFLHATDSQVLFLRTLAFESTIVLQLQLQAIMTNYGLLRRGSQSPINSHNFEVI